MRLPCDLEHTCTWDARTRLYKRSRNCARHGATVKFGTKSCHRFGYTILARCARRCKWWCVLGVCVAWEVCARRRFCGGGRRVCRVRVASRCLRARLVCCISAFRIVVAGRALDAYTLHIVLAACMCDCLVCLFVDLFICLAGCVICCLSGCLFVCQAACARVYSVRH